MKKIFQNVKSGELELKDVPAPVVQSGMILVKNYFSAVSYGTEKATIQLAKKNLLEKARARPDLVKEVINKIKKEGLFSVYNKVSQKLDEPIALGYSCAGEVVAVGDGVKGFSIGDKVACAGQNYACHAEIVSVPSNLCVKIFGETSLKDASLVALGAISLQGIRRANLALGEKIAVIGLGLIGQITAQILKAYGFSVVGIDVDARKVEKCLKAGLDSGLILGKDDIPSRIRNFTNNAGVDAAIITASSKDNGPMDLAGEILREKGKVSVVGDIKIEIPRRTYYKKEIDVFISKSYGPGRYDKNYEEGGIDYPLGHVRWTEKRNMEEFIRLVADRKINVEFLITHIFKIDEFQNVYDLILNNKKGEDIGAVIFSYPITSESKNSVYFFESTKESIAEKINVGVIGVGNFSQSIIFPALKDIKEAKIFAVADSEGEKAKRVCLKYKCDYATTDYKNILDDKNVNLAIIATRHSYHAEMAMNFLKRNKNVHIEKPLALTKNELEEVINEAKNSKGRLMVGYNRRFSDFIVKAKQFIGKENFPFIMSYRINAGFIPSDNWVQDKKEGGRVIGEVCHFVDLMQFLADSRPNKVYATQASVADGAEDNLISIINFENGSRASIVYSSLGNVNLPKEYIEIFTGNKAVVIKDFKEMEMINGSSSKRIRLFNQDKGHKQEFCAFVDAIKNGQPSPINIQELFFASKATFAILDSLKENKAIEF